MAGSRSQKMGRLLELLGGVSRVVEWPWPAPVMSIHETAPNFKAPFVCDNGSGEREGEVFAVSIMSETSRSELFNRVSDSWDCCFMGHGSAMAVSADFAMARGGWGVGLDCESNITIEVCDSGSHGTREALTSLVSSLVVSWFPAALTLPIAIEWCDTGLHEAREAPASVVRSPVLSWFSAILPTYTFKVC